MRFICTEVGGKFMDLYKNSLTDDTVLMENGSVYKKLLESSTEKGKLFKFGRAELKKLSGSFLSKEATISAFFSSIDVALVSNITSSAVFAWNPGKVSKLTSSFFFVILTENGVEIHAPVRAATSKEINSKKVLSRTSDFNTSVKFEGESGADFYINSEKTSCMPILMDSAMKNMALNKYMALSDVIEIASGEDLNPLDYIRHEGSIYVAISRRPISETEFVYTMVLEKNENKTFSGADLKLYSAKLTDDGGLAILLINRTGSSSIKGEIVRPDPTTPGAVTKIIIDRPDPIGVFLESGVPDYGYAWIVVSGIAYIYVIGSTSQGWYVRGFITGDSGYIAGQGKTENVPSAPFSSDKHFYEIGHCIEGRYGAGLVRCVIHFN